MRETLAVTLIVLGACSLVAALAGGLHFGDVEFPILQAAAPRVMLGVVGVALVGLGFGTWNTDPVAADPAGSDVRYTAAADPSPTASRTAAEASTSTVAAYRRAAGSACQRVRANMKPLRDSSPEDLTADLEADGRLFGDLATDLAALEAPPAVAAGHDALTTAVANVGDQLSGAAAALDAGDSKLLDQRFAQLTRARSQLNEVARAVSLPLCALG